MVASFFSLIARTQQVNERHYFTFGHVSDFEGSALRLIGRWVLSMGATLRGAPVFVFGLLGGGGACRGI
jgi:hypothetical protein